MRRSSALDPGQVTNAPGGTAHWTFTGGTNYKDQSGDVTIDIAKANATVSVSGYSGTYDGAEHGATGSATVSLNEGAHRSGNIGAKFTNVPGGTAHWVFTRRHWQLQRCRGRRDRHQQGQRAIGSTATPGLRRRGARRDRHGHRRRRHEARAASTRCLPSPTSPAAPRTGSSPTAPATTTTPRVTSRSPSARRMRPSASAVTPESTTVRRTARPARPRASAVRASPASTSGASFSDVPGGTAHWVFTDVTGNYNNAEGDVGITISKADATISVTGYTGVYDGAAHGRPARPRGSAARASPASTSAAIAMTTRRPRSTGNYPQRSHHIQGPYWPPPPPPHQQHERGTSDSERSSTRGHQPRRQRRKRAFTIAKASPICTVDGYNAIVDNLSHGDWNGNGVDRVRRVGRAQFQSDSSVPGTGMAIWTLGETANHRMAAGKVSDAIGSWTTVALSAGRHEQRRDRVEHGEGWLDGSSEVQPHRWNAEKDKCERRPELCRGPDAV